jgi:hypothetical protein
MIGWLFDRPLMRGAMRGDWNGYGVKSIDDLPVLTLQWIKCNI